jgi:regulator of sigma D
MGNENMQVAANYITTFYNDVVNLTHFYLNYENTLTEIGVKNGKDAGDGLSPEEKDTVKVLCQTIRYYSNKTMLTYNAILKSTEDKEDKKLAEIMKKIKPKLIPAVEDIEEYVTAMNAVLVKGVIKDLLETSQDLVKSIYGPAEDKTDVQK